MKQFKVGDLVEYLPGMPMRAAQRGRCPGIILSFWCFRGLHREMQNARVLWRGDAHTMLVDVRHLMRFDPQSTKEYNAN